MDLASTSDAFKIRAQDLRLKIRPMRIGAYNLKFRVRHSKILYAALFRSAHTLPKPADRDNSFSGGRVNQDPAKNLPLFRTDAQ